MLTVWKYPIPIQDDIRIEMPRGAQMLTVQVQHGDPCVWALVDPSLDPEPRRFRLAGTGHPITEAVRHVGSFQLMRWGIGFHLFEVMA